MKLSQKEQRLIKKIRAVLERRREIGTLTTKDVSSAELAALLSSENADMQAAGQYVLSLIPVHAAHAHLRKIKSTREAYSQYLLAEAAAEGPVGLATAWPKDLAEHLSADVTSVSSFLVGPADVPPQARRPEITIIVHGTWAAGETWWRQGSPFWNHIDGLTQNAYRGDDPFSWPGNNKHAVRVQAAAALREWVRLHPCDHLDAVAHSHGGNVCILASRLGVKFRRLVLLGTPIRLEYLPDMRNVGVISNVFSTADEIQTPLGTFPNCRGEGRTLGDNSQVMNYRAMDDGGGSSPGHGDLHEPATWNGSDLNCVLS